jgi:hypothetical protein
MSLLSQKQGEFIDSFNNRFRTIAILVQFNDPSLRSLYLKAIKTELCQELYHCHPYPETLEATMSSCEIIESRINHINRLSGREQVRSFRNTSVDRRENQEESSQERSQRSRLGLCLYCGEKGHLINQCPKNLKNEKARL